MRALAADARDGEQRLVLATPTTFMNISGEAVRELSRWYKVPLEKIVIVHDDLDLALGVLRIKRGGGDGGHNGLKHITRALGSPDYARVRIGIGRPQGRQDPVDYVLQAFTKAEQETISVVFEQAADAALAVVRDGVDATQNTLHAGEQKPKARRVRKQVVVDAPIKDVWDAWTTSEGAIGFFAPRARIVLEEGGAYELLFDLSQPSGKRGSEGCTVLGFEEPRQLAFEWNAPPSLPTVRDFRTRVDVALRARGGARTQVTLTHTGWGEGGEWDEAVVYFDRAWDVVLARLQQLFFEGPIAWG